jgi:hypothetical protein
MRYLCATIAVLLTCAQAFAKGGSMRSEDRYNPQHIQSLSPEVRNAIMRMCGETNANCMSSEHFGHLVWR